MDNTIIKLTASTEKQWQNIYRSVSYQNKDYFTQRLKAFYAFFKSNKLTIKWHGGDSKILTKLCDATSEVTRMGVGAMKQPHIDFLCGILAVKENLFKLADLMLSCHTIELAELLVSQGAVNFDSIKQMLNWPIVRENTHWYTGLGLNTESRWYGSCHTAPLALMCDIIVWVAEKQESRYYYRFEPYVTATASLVEYVLSHRKNVSLKELADTKGFTEFSGADFRGKCRLLQQLTFSGALKPGKTKISVAELKKFANYIPLAAFPHGAAADEKERDLLTMTMSFYLFGTHKDGFQFPSREMPEPKFMRKMYNLLSLKLFEIYSLMFSDRPKHVTGYFFQVHQKNIESMVQLVQHTLMQSDKILHDKWVDVLSLDAVANRKLAECSVHYIMLEGHNSNSSISSVRRPKEYLPLSDVKREVHDKIIPFVLKGMALLGGLDLLFNATGKIVAVRLTDLGRWLLGITKDFPAGAQQPSDDDIFEVDDATRMVIVKKPEHPYAKVISDYAEKVSGERWRITQAALLKGCTTAQALRSKISSLKNFIIAKPGPNLQHLLDSMLGRCNKVLPFKESFMLFKIDPDDDMLHAIIQDTPEINDNTLKVECCCLLVKADFVPTFFSLLRGRGYFTDLEF